MRRPVYAASEGGTVAPLDAWLGVVRSLVSAGARELCYRAAMAGVSFRKASENLARLAQVRVSHDRVRQIVEADGCDDASANQGRALHGAGLPYTSTSM
ncbi:MAG: hypothetical protein NTX40_07880 [Planctomycetota bacterium]|nr:hypothetical protein [Planctomycetota bacterium]